MKIIIELDMIPYDKVSDDPNETFANVLRTVNAAAARLADELPFSATVERVQVQR